jgi:hypothetical protein
MIITPFEGLTRYHAEPESKGQTEPYLIDLTLNGGIGWCDCPHFRCRLAPQIHGTATDFSAMRCKHIKAARELLANHLLETFLKTEVEKTKKETKT